MGKFLDYLHKFISHRISFHSILIQFDYYYYYLLFCLTILHFKCHNHKPTNNIGQNDCLKLSLKTHCQTGTSARISHSTVNYVSILLLKWIAAVKTLLTATMLSASKTLSHYDIVDDNNDYDFVDVVQHYDDNSAHKHQHQCDQRKRHRQCHLCQNNEPNGQKDDGNLLSLTMEKMHRNNVVNDDHNHQIKICTNHHNYFNDYHHIVMQPKFIIATKNISAKKHHSPVNSELITTNYNKIFDTYFGHCINVCIKNNGKW